MDIYRKCYLVELFFHLSTFVSHWSLLDATCNQVLWSAEKKKSILQREKKNTQGGFGIKRKMVMQKRTLSLLLTGNIRHQYCTRRH